MGCIRKKKVQGLQLTNMYKQNLLLKSNLRMLNEDLDLAKSMLRYFVFLLITVIILASVLKRVFGIDFIAQSKEYDFIKNDTNKSN
jgi:hypothetical protein